MRYVIIVSPEAIEDLRGLKAPWRARVCDAIEEHLRYAPAQESRSQIKRLQGVSRPQCRLRVHEIRVYYDVSEQTVEILAILLKSETNAWLRKEGQQ